MTNSKPALVIEANEPARTARGDSDSAIFEAPAAPAPVIETGSAPAIVNEDGEDNESLPDRAETNEDGSITLPLRFPVTLQIRTQSTGHVRTETFERLTFYRLVGADIRALTAASAEAQPAVLLAKSARIRDTIAARLFDEMDASDIRDMTAVASHFFGGGRDRKTAR